MILIFLMILYQLLDNNGDQFDDHKFCRNLSHCVKNNVTNVDFPNKQQQCISKKIANIFNKVFAKVSRDHNIGPGRENVDMVKGRKRH
jgi:hypothetical protein